MLYILQKQNSVVVIALFLVLFLGASFTARAQAGGITYLDVGMDYGKDATQNQNGAGWTWNASTNTFTLTGNITFDIIFRGGAGDVNFVVNGSYTVTDRIIQNVGKLTISGSGTLSINNTTSNPGLSAGGDLEISGATVNITQSGSANGVFLYGHDLIMSSGALNVTATDNNVYGILIEGGDLNISGTASVSATSANRNGIYCKSINISGGTLVGGSDSRAGIYATDDITISGGSVTANSSVVNGYALGADKDINVTGGSLTTGGTTGNLDIAGTLNVNGATANVTINGRIRKNGGNGGNLSVSNGTVSVTSTVAGNVTVSGGTVTVGGAISGTVNHTGGTLNGNTPPPAYAATLNINKDGSPFTIGNSYTLKLSGNETTTVNMTGTGATRTASVPNGTWKIFDFSFYTGVTIVISGAAGSATINYYTVSFTVSDAGLASGSTIDALRDGNSIYTGAIVLGGSQIVITASGAGAPNYTYAWGGTHGASAVSGTDATLTVSNVSGTINVACTVTGTATVTGIDSPEATALKTCIQNGTLHVDGLTAGKQWAVYNISGALIYGGITGSDTAEVSLPVRGVYIVKSGNTTVKVAY